MINHIAHSRFLLRSLCSTAFCCYWVNKLLLHIILCEHRVSSCFYHQFIKLFKMGFNLLYVLFVRVRALFIIMCVLLTSSIMANPLDLVSVNTGSFLYHAIPANADSTQYFDNRYFSIERKLDADSDYSFMIGTFLNSQNERCALLGARKDWYRFSDKLVFKGVYAYAGEFFIEAFEDCGQGGFYEDMKNSTGVGFSPYIYHAAQYNFTDYLGVEGGLMLPGILVMSLQWTF